MIKRLIDPVVSGYDGAVHNSHQVHASTLITGSRIDIVIKLRLLKAMQQQNGSYDYWLNVYTNHLKCFGEGTIQEPNNPEKSNENAYLDEFKRLYEDIKLNGFNSTVSLIPISPSSIPLDGAHRIAILQILKKQASVTQVDAKNKLFNLQYFKKRGLERQYIYDALAEYANELKSERHFHSLILWDFYADKHNDLEKFIGDRAEILFAEDITINQSFAKELIRTCYSKENWIGKPENNYTGVTEKQFSCFRSGEGKIRVIFVETKSSGDCTKIKEDARRHFGGTKHLLHSTDTYSEFVDILLFCKYNYDKVHLIISEYSRQVSLIEKLAKFKKILKCDNSQRKFAIGGSAIMELLGLRTARDIDFITYQRDAISASKNNESYYEDKNIYEVVKNNNNIYYHNFIFLGPRHVTDYKKNRGEAKDRVDIALLDGVGDRSLLSMLRNQIKPRLQILIRRIYFRTRKLLARVKLLKYIYRMLKK